MILYFDSYITDAPLHSWPKVRAIEKSIQDSCKAYRKQDKVDIAKYTLASYAVYPWSKVIIKYQLENTSKNEEFEEFIREVFDCPVIINNRSEDTDGFNSALDLCYETSDEWIFYSGNNDHPMILSELDQLDKLLNKAEDLKSKYGNNISVVYSHLPELMELANQNHLRSIFLHPDIKQVDNDDDTVSFYYPYGNPDSMQIIHRDLLRKWMSYPELKGKRIFRTECVEDFVKLPQQYVVFPKYEVCRHYDAYFHTILNGKKFYISETIVPPLFIPDGFFENDIKISYGYNNYRDDGWINVNPTNDKYIFENNKGTDLKLLLSDLPLFWKDRISIIDKNETFDTKLAAEFNKRRLYDLTHPVKMTFNMKIFVLFLKLKRLLRRIYRFFKRK